MRIRNGLFLWLELRPGLRLRRKGAPFQLIGFVGVGVVHLGGAEGGQGVFVAGAFGVREVEQGVIVHQHPGAGIGGVVGQQLLGVGAIGAECERVLVLDSGSGTGNLAILLNLVEAPVDGG
mgnify:CR=1 FL=1